MINTSHLSDSDLQMIRDAFNAELERRRAAETEARDAELLQADRNLAEYEAEYTKTNAKLFAEFERLTRNYDIHVNQAEKHKALAEETAEAMGKVQDKLSVTTRTLNEIKSRRERIHKAWIQSHPTR